MNLKFLPGSVPRFYLKRSLLFAGWSSSGLRTRADQACSDKLKGGDHGPKKAGLGFPMTLADTKVQSDRSDR